MLAHRLASRHAPPAAQRTRRTTHVVHFQRDTAESALDIAKGLNTKLLINGDWTPSTSGATLPVVDPRTEQEFMQVSAADAADVDKAVAAARRAFDEGPWPRMTARERGAIMFKLADLIEAHAEQLAQLETLDTGKPLGLSRFVDIPMSASQIRYTAGWADKIQGRTVRADGPFFAYTLHEPIGVVGQIIPWNFPLLMASWKIAPALACGNTVVLKVAEQTPLTALKLGELALEAGLPPGVLNILPGYGETAGAALSKHKGIDKIAFTGSTEVGRLVGKAAAENIIPCTLELGGKSPVIVAKDADMEQAVATAHEALFFNQGQACTAGSRVFVHEAIHDEFVERAAAAAKARKVGDPFNNDTQQGPQVNAEQFRKVMGYIEKGKQQGASLRAGGNRCGQSGYFIEPTVFADASDDMAIAREEIFGPVQTIMKFSSLDEAICRANATNYGLAAAVFTRDIDTVNTVSRGLRSGTVWVNCYSVIDRGMPFGGYKDSGIGREGGEYVLHDYTQVKAVYQPLVNTPWL